MSDTQPLLSSTDKISDDGEIINDNKSKKPRLANSFSNFYQYFRKKETDDNVSHKCKDKTIGIFQLLNSRFADRLDFLLYFITVCFLILHVVCVFVSLVMLGRLGGMFSIQSSASSCQYQHENSIHNYSCPLGIELNLFNYHRFNKLCRHTETFSSSTLDISMVSFREKVMNIVYWLLIIGIVQIPIAAIDCNAWAISVKRQITRMNIFLFQSLIYRSISYYDLNPTSQLSAQLFTNIEKIEAGIGLEFFALIGVLVCIPIALIISFVVNWQLSLIMLCIIPIVFGISFMFSKLTANETANELKAYSKAGQIVQEIFSSLRTVLSLNGIQFEKKRYEQELHPTHWSSVRKGIVFGVFMGWLSLIVYIVYSVGFIFGSLLVSSKDHNRLNISDILVVVILFSQCIRYFNMLGSSLQSLAEARGAATTVFQLIDEAQDTSINEPDIWKEDSSDEEPISNINGDIEFDNINFVYPSRNEVSVLNNLTLIARARQTTALVGSSGCGKSTCISLLLRYYEPSSGRIMIDGRSITDYNLKQLRQNIGVVNQEPILFGTTVYDNIRFGKINATRAEIEEAARQANAHNFIMQLPNKYDTLVGERGIQLSGGEKQRVALARALIKQPSFLLLDEATSALDSMSEKIVQEALDRACNGRTTVVIAHRLTTIKNADYIYVLDNGSVIEEGTHEILMNKEGGKYQAMVKSQQMIEIDDDDDVMNGAKMRDEDEKFISQRSHLLSDNSSNDVNKKSSASLTRGSIFLRLLSLNRPEWMMILIGCIACMMSGAAQSVFAILLAKIVQAFNDCNHSERHRQVLIFSFILLLLGFILLVVQFCQYTSFAIAGSKLTQRIRSMAFACLLRQEVAYFDRAENSSGAICARLSSDALAIQQMAGTRLGVICEAVSVFVFGLLFGSFFNFQLTIIVLLFYLILIFINYLNIRLGIWLKRQTNVVLRQASSLAVEVIHNMRTIKQLSIEKEVLRQFSQFIDQEYRLSWKPIILNGIVYGTSWGMQRLVLACLYWRALVLVENSQLAMKNITIVFGFAVFSTQSPIIISILARRIAASLSAAESFFDLFDRTPTIDNTSTKGKELIDFRGEIEFDQVNFIYPIRPTSVVLNKLQLIIKSGQRVALVGQSGCGKSTIIQLLERFYDVTQGQLFLDGVDIRQLNIQWLRSCFGLVSQEPILFDLTIAENISYGLENVSMEDIINAATKANIHDFIQQLPLGYETKVGMKGSFLSGGEKQRIAIARALLRRPKILLLDEATSAMDSYNEQIIQQTLEQAQTEDSSRTSLIIAHRLSTIRSCDLICFMDNGHIVESGTHTQLVQQRGAYYRMLIQNNFTIKMTKLSQSLIGTLEKRVAFAFHQKIKRCTI